MLFDLKRNKNLNIPKCFIKGEEVERVDCYKYLGTIIDNKLLFDMNCDMIFKKNVDRGCMCCIVLGRSMQVKG